MLEKTIEDVAANLLKLAVIKLPKDIKQSLGKAIEQENNEIAKAQLSAILKNIQLAENMNAPVCQDTGIITFYLTIGDRFPNISSIPTILRNATQYATENVPLRPNAVDPFTGRNSGDNTGKHIPYINWDIVAGDTLQITVLPKGAGSENNCALEMLNPSQGIKGVKRFVVDSVIAAGSKPCPPIIVGVGIGGGPDIALSLSKRALLRSIDRHHENSEVAKLEEELYVLTNQTGIGPMGLGGDTTVLGVNVEYAHRHTASLPAAIAIQCWAARKATARLWPNGKVEYLTHKV